jgi:hypothetical protein
MLLRKFFILMMDSLALDFIFDTASHADSWESSEVSSHFWSNFSQLDIADDETQSTFDYHAKDLGNRVNAPNVCSLTYSQWVETIE